MRATLSKDSLGGKVGLPQWTETGLSVFVTALASLPMPDNEPRPERQ